MDYRLEDLIDVPGFQALQDSLARLVSFPCSIIDNESNVLTATGWQPVCTQFHRVNPTTAAQCRQSDRYILRHLEDGGQTVTYECPHGLVDAATPIIIDGMHLGNLFTGQFFLEPPDTEFFRRQARQYGFDEAAYLEAVARVPVWDREQLAARLAVMRHFTEMLGEIGLQRLRLLDSERRFRAMFDASALGIAVTAMDGRHLDCNSALLQMLGLTREEFLNLRADDFTHPDDIDPHVPAWRELLARERESYQREVRYLHKDGHVVWARLTVSRCAYGGDGQEAALALVEDITEQVRAQTELRTSEEKFSKAFRSSPDAIVLTRLADGRLMEVNEGFTTMTGYSREEAVGRTMFELGLWVDVRDREEVVQTVQRGASVRNRGFRFRMKDGRELIGLTSVDMIPVGAEPHLLATVRDVTEQLQAEEALRESEERYRSLYQSLPGGVLVVDREGRVTEANQAACDILRLDRDQILGLGPRDSVWSPVYEDGSPFPWEAYPTSVTLRTGQPQRGVTVGLFSDGPDGPRWLMINSEPLVDAETGETKAAVANFVDITESRHAEAERRRLEAQLQREQRLESIGVLAGGIAHDFNNILAGISGFTELSLGELEPTTPLASNLTQVLEATQRAQELVRQILAFCRQAPMAQKPTSMQRLVDDALGFARASLPATIEIRSQPAPKELVVRADATQIQQVILNICANAEHAMRPQGGILSVSLEAADIGAEQARALGEIAPGHYAVLSLADTGCGMDAATRQRIFDPFFTTKEQGEGTGLGLSTCYGIVAGHGGAIGAESELGRGTTFRVHLPLTDEPVVETPREVDAEPPTGEGRILFVDDEAALTTVGERMLRRLGFEATVVSSGQEALDAFRADPDGFDLILTDQTMSGMTGLALAAEVRKTNATVPIVIMTGFSGDVTPERTAALNVGEVLAKPFTVHELAAALQRALTRA